jgi:hypothetical protein
MCADEVLISVQQSGKPQTDGNTVLAVWPGSAHFREQDHAAAIWGAPAAHVISDAALAAGALAGTVLDVADDAAVPVVLLGGGFEPLDLRKTRRSTLDRDAGG